MPQINYDVWLADDAAFTGLNTRTGTSAITDTDYENFAPFKLAYYPSGQNHYTLWNWMNGGELNLNEEIDTSMCYVGIYNNELPQLNIGSYSFDTYDTINNPLFKTDPDQVQSFFFTDSWNFMFQQTQIPNNSRIYGDNRLYDKSFNYFDYKLQKYVGGTIGAQPHISPSNTTNLNAWLNIYLSFGIKTLILEINVIYKTGNGTFYPDQAQCSLGDYVLNTTEWKAAHPILQAYCKPYIRGNTNGTYSNTGREFETYNCDQTFVPAFTLPMLSQNSDYDDITTYTLTMNTGQSTRNGFLPLYGVMSGELALSATLTSVQNMGISAPLMGINKGTLGKRQSSGYMYYWLELDGSNDDNIEWLRRAAAAYGLFFCDDIGTLGNSGRDIDRWFDDNMMLGTIDEEGHTNGDYTRGIQNITQRQWEWSDSTESPYDPSVPPTPQPSQNPLLPVGLEFTLANEGTTIYCLNPSEIHKAWNDIFGSGVSVEQFGNNPMNAILSLKWTPFDWTYSGDQHEKPIILGDQVANPLHSYKNITNINDAEKHGWGEIQFKYDKNFYNARNMQARLFLPFYGYYELPVAQLLSSKLRVDFYYDIPDELGVWIISYDDVIYDYCECAIDMDVPLTGSNAAAISANKKSEALTIATQIASTAATVAIGIGSAVGIRQAAQHLAAGVDVVAAETGVGFADVGLETGAYLGSKGFGKAFGTATKTALGLSGGGGALGIVNTVRNARLERASLRTNLPYHGSALQTTFLHMSMKPYVQIFKNSIMQGLDVENGGTVQVKLGGTSETQYKLKVGHACNIWAAPSSMPSNSLCQTTGIADMSTSGMELSEIQELNEILQSGFYTSLS